MIIENPEFKEVTIQYSWGDQKEKLVVPPKGVPGKHGVVIVMLDNLKYFLEMFTLEDRERYLSPYEILAELEERVREDIERGGIQTCYLVGYKRDLGYDGDVIFLFSCFEVNVESEPDENYRSLYINFEFNGSAS